MNKIIKKEIIFPEVKLFEVEAPMIARKTQAGQFVVVRNFEKGERIPLTVADNDPEKGTITLVFQEVGKSTMQMGTMEEGDFILDVAGPLGHPSEIENFGTVVVVGGGIGIAPIYPITRALYKAGNRVISILGARSKDLLFFEDRMEAVSHEMFITTDDGSKGMKGFVTDQLKKILDTEKVDRVVAIGPMIMMKFVSGTTKPYGVPTIVSLNSIMVDGTGMCGACRCEVAGETKFACVDGPEFDGHKVDFDLLLNRSKMYSDFEKAAVDNYKKGCK